MKHFFRSRNLLILGLLLVGMPLQSHASEVKHPTAAGDYENKNWKYSYKVESKGTKSERRIGMLFFEGKPVVGKIGEVRKTPWGNFIYFGKNNRWNQGWLNTLTYDQPVFGKDGKPTKKICERLTALQPKATQ